MRIEMGLDNPNISSLDKVAKVEKFSEILSTVRRSGLGQWRLNRDARLELGETFCLCVSPGSVPRLKEGMDIELHGTSDFAGFFTGYMRGICSQKVISRLFQ